MPSGGGLSLNEAKPQSKKRQLVCIIIPRARRHWGLFHYLFIERVYTRPLRVSTRFATGHFAKPKCKNIAGKRIDRRNRSINDARTANCWRVFLCFFCRAHRSVAIARRPLIGRSPSNPNRRDFAKSVLLIATLRDGTLAIISFDWIWLYLLIDWWVDLLFLFFLNRTRKTDQRCRRRAVFGATKKKKEKKKVGLFSAAALPVTLKREKMETL